MSLYVLNRPPSRLTVRRGLTAPEPRIASETRAPGRGLASIRHWRNDTDERPSRFCVRQRAPCGGGGLPPGRGRTERRPAAVTHAQRSPAFPPPEPASPVPRRPHGPRG